jgi:release factor glutamine methyltransferase
MAETIDTWLRCSTQSLQEAAIPTARLDALVLLCDETGQDKAWVLAHPEYVLQGSAVEKLHTKVTQRAQHVPLAYIRGKVEFYGREFAVNEHVLVPRPESEAMIELAKRVTSPPAERAGLEPACRAGRSRVTIFDIGTGSGALAITAKLEVPGARVTATDIDAKCLLIAQQNARKLGAKVEFVRGDLLEPLRDSIPARSAGGLETRDSIILANLPYVPAGYPVNKAASHEPASALFSGTDGLDHYRRLFAQAAELPHRPTYIITESLEQQHGELQTLAEAHGYMLAAAVGLAHCFQSQVKPTD